MAGAAEEVAGAAEEVAGAAAEEDGVSDLAMASTEDSAGGWLAEML